MMKQHLPSIDAADVVIRVVIIRVDVVRVDVVRVVVISSVVPLHSDSSKSNVCFPYLRIYSVTICVCFIG